MQNLILISSETAITNEIQLVESMMTIDENVRFHLRKPQWTKEDCQAFLKKMDTRFLSRISVHQHHDLDLNFPKIGVHYKEKDRASMPQTNSISSTSFHTEKDALLLGSDFNYFFCSPIFQSISKAGYLPKEKWNLKDWPSVLVEKAVALGGLNVATISQAKQLGFSQFAALGAVWMAKNPLNAFKEISELCQK